MPANMINKGINIFNKENMVFVHKLHGRTDILKHTKLSETLIKLKTVK
jgi:hypothetical protein